MSSGGASDRIVTPPELRSFSAVGPIRRKHESRSRGGQGLAGGGSVAGLRPPRANAATGIGTLIPVRRMRRRRRGSRSSRKVTTVSPARRGGNRGRSVRETTRPSHRPSCWVHSAGSVVALQFALDYPARAAGLVLVGAASECAAAAQRFYEEVARLAEREGMDPVRCRLGLRRERDGVAEPNPVAAKVARCMGNLHLQPLTLRLHEIRCPTLD